jgi:hypothetical protein
MLERKVRELARLSKVAVAVFGGGLAVDFAEDGAIERGRRRLGRRAVRTVLPLNGELVFKVAASGEF